MSAETTITEADYGRFKKYIEEMEAAGWIVKSATEGRWVPEGEACCWPAAQIIHIRGQGGKVHIGLGERCEDNVAAAPPVTQPDTRPLTPRAELVMRLADDEAGRLGDTEVTPQHILRALLREGESIAAGVLESLIHPDKLTTALDFIEGRSK